MEKLSRRQVFEPSIDTVMTNVVSLADAVAVKPTLLS